MNVSLSVAAVARFAGVTRCSSRAAASGERCVTLLAGPLLGWVARAAAAGVVALPAAAQDRHRHDFPRRCRAKLPG